MTRIEESGVRGQGIAACGLADGPRSWCVSAPSAKPQAAESSLTPVPCPLTPPRSGVTLVELLITIAIIAILATAILGVAAVATTTAREARTRNTITRLHTLLTEHYDTYKVRRVKLNQALENDVNDRFTNNPRQRGEALAQARLYALRELMLMEIPDRWSDVVLGPTQTVSVGATWRNPLYCAERTGLSSLYRRQFERLLAAVNSLTGAKNTPAEIIQNQGAECLYLTIMYACGDGEARSLFSEKDIGDTDGDSAPEFLDAWGNPIQFLRWAAGFESDAQLNPYRFGTDQSAWVKAADADHDPFDMYRRDRFAFRLVPLIYSAGNDEEFGIETNDVEQVWYTAGGVTNANPNVPPYSYFAPHLSPYQQISPTIPFTGTPIDGSGQPNTAAATDNIHNHLVGTR